VVIVHRLVPVVTVHKAVAIVHRVATNKVVVTSKVVAAIAHKAAARTVHKVAAATAHREATSQARAKAVTKTAISRAVTAPVLATRAMGQRWCTAAAVSLR